MRNDVAPYPSPDLQRCVSVTLWPISTTYAQVIGGSASGGLDLSANVQQLRHTHSDASIRLAAWDYTHCANQPKPGQLISIDADGRRLWNGAIEAVNEYRESRGERSLSITARSRDAFGLWRDNRFTTQVYPAGTELARIARDVAGSLGLTPSEYDLPATGFTVPHTNAQMGDMSPWDILETVLLPAGLAPMIDARGRLKTYRKDPTRAADLTLGQDRVLAITGSHARPPISNVKLRWLDKNLSKSAQQDQVLCRESITAGFFMLTQKRKAWFSKDRSQRAEKTYMKVLQSVNDGLLPVGSEQYTQNDPFHGTITVTTDAWVPLLASASLIALLAASKLPDIAPPFGGPTIPTGKIVHGLAEVAILLTMMSLGTGHYEIWGTPYDYIHTRNTTEAYNPAAPSWMDAEKVIDNDFVTSEGHAQMIAVRELLYGIASASTWGAQIVDDPRLEPGDIIQLPDHSRLYVTGYSRDLSRGSAAALDVQGFRT